LEHGVTKPTNKEREYCQLYVRKHWISSTSITKILCSINYSL